MIEEKEGIDLKKKKLANSEWRLSFTSLFVLLGTYIGISFGRNELNLQFALGYLAVWGVVVVCNTISVLYKRNKNNGT